jgi:hypothetical protein
MSVTQKMYDWQSKRLPDTVIMSVRGNGTILVKTKEMQRRGFKLTGSERGGLGKTTLTFERVSPSSS